MSGARRSKISDVAAMAGVSKSTVSNYLNGRYGSMSPETKEKISKAIKKLNYTPSISARRLSSKISCNVVCVVIPIELSETFETLYYPTVLSALGKISIRTGYDTLLYARGESDRRLAYLKGMANTLVDGFILFDLRSDSQYFREFERSNIPYVCVGKYHDVDDYNYVASDHGKAIAEAAEYLTALGHNRIGMVQENNGSVVAQVRQAHYESALHRHGLRVSMEYIAEINTFGPDVVERNARACKSLLLRPDRPTALICPTGTLPIIERIAAENGIAIPRDMSVVALDYMDGYNLQIANYTRFPSMAGHVSEMAFTKLISYITNKKSSFRSEMIPLCMLRGDTTVPPNG